MDRRLLIAFVYKGLSHGMATTQHDFIDADLLAFLKA